MLERQESGSNLRIFWECETCDEGSFVTEDEAAAQDHRDDNPTHAVYEKRYEPQRPTLPGKVEGIVGWDPIQLQCRDCGRIHTGTRNPAAEIILSRFHFHRCEGRDGKRRCPSCLAAVEAACPKLYH